VNLREIKEIIRMLSDTDIAEFILESEGVKLSLRKKEAFAVSQVIQSGAAIVATPSAASDIPVVSSVPAVDADNLLTIVAPMVGTFYRSPSPDSPSYVNVGDTVEIGEPLCIIEAMKLMNEIESEAKGRIVRILAENAQPVEYGQPLFVIEPA